MNIIFATNSSFGGVVFKKILEKKIVPSLLITSTSKERDLPCLMARDLASKNSVVVAEVEDKEAFHNIISEQKPDLVVLAAFGMIIPEKTLQLTRFINVHPSLLPKYRGATPIQGAIIDNVEKSGVSVIEMTAQIDGGPIIAQKEISILLGTTYEQAEILFAVEGGDLLADVIALKGESNSKEQDNEQATYTKILTKEDGKIDWREPAELIERKVRALNPWPGTFTKMGEKNFKILEADVQEQTSTGPFGNPGKIYLGTNHSIAVQTGKHFLLIKKLQIEGKNPTTSKDFLQGNLQSIGTTLS